MRKRKKRGERDGRSRKALALEELGGWLLALAVLVLVIVAVIILTGKGEAIIEHIKNLFRFR